MRTLKMTALVLSSFLAAGALAACGETGTGGGDPPEEPGYSEYDSKRYDFGDPASWAGDSVTVTDLGDCLIDEYPSDNLYDWGQSILYDIEAGVYKMWWCRQSGYDTIWYAESKDLKHWTSATKIIVVEQDSTWLKMHVGKPTVLKVGGKYVMYCEAPATLNRYKEFDNNVLRATSDDGLHWEFYTGNTNEPYPVIRMSDQDMAASWEKSQESGGSGYGYYGIGQPSACYVNGTYYLYCTYSLEAGDRMYLFTSKDGITFDAGTQVFTRAGCGVKYNDTTGKFMLAYEYTMSGLSKIYYMESDDGVHFTYSNYTEASQNKNVISRGHTFVHGYPDFVADEYGHTQGYTLYAAYMEGKAADAGNDWRQYSATWDIHISMFNLPAYAKRTQVLPNGLIKHSETMKPYNEAHTEYETRSAIIGGTSSAPKIDGVKDSLYDSATVLSVDRCVFQTKTNGVDDTRSVPGKTTAKICVTYTDDAFYLFAEVFDDEAQEGDRIAMLLDEKRFAENLSDIVYITAGRTGVSVTDGTLTAIPGAQTAVRSSANGYCAEIMLPRRNPSATTIGFDAYVYDNPNNLNFKSIRAWNDFHALCDVRTAGELRLS